MRKTDATITLALCASLLGHGLLMDTMIHEEIKRLEAQTGCGPIDVLDFLRRNHRIGIAKIATPEDDPIAKPLIDPIELPHPETKMTYEDIFGEHGGKGKANETTAGDVAMQAEHADEDQAFLNHNPNANITRPGENTPRAASSTAANSGGGGGGGEGGENGGGATPASTGNLPVAIVANTPDNPKGQPFGVPLSPPPSLLPPAPLSKAHPLIAMRIASATKPPTTQRIDDHPLNPTTQSIVTRENSPATRPTNIDPGQRATSATVAFATPSTQPAVNPAATQPSQIAMQPLNIEGPTGILPTTQQALAKLPTTLPSKFPETPADRPDPFAIASIGEALPHLEMPLQPSPAATPGRPGAPSAPGMPGAPGTTAPAAPAASEGGNKSESESDPFTSESTKNFAYVNGHVEAKDGRKVKTVRPKLSDSARGYVLDSLSARVDLLLKIDKTGKVRGVDIIPGHASGNAGVDLAAIRAAFEWEFEPPKDPVGRPLSDVQVIPFVWIVRASE